MTELSALGVKITSSGVVKTTNELDAFAIASRKAAQANKPINVKVTGVGAAKVLADIQRINQALKSMGAGTSNSLTSVSVSGVDKAISDLAKFTSALGAARTAASKPIVANVSLSGGSSGGGRSGGGKPKIVQDLDDVNKAFKFTATEGLNFSRQMADIGVTAAMGMNPLMIAIQQGPQLFDILQTAGQRSGKGVSGALRAAAASAGTFTAALGLAAVAVGTAVVAWNVWLGQVNDEKKSGLEAYAKAIGLTKYEIEKAGGAAVTSADMIGGLWDATKRALELDALFKDVERWITDAFNSAVANAKQNLSELYAAIYVIDDILAYVGKHGGEVFADGLIQGINAGIRAINEFGTVYGPDGKPFWEPNIAEVKNDYAGAGSAAAGAFATAITDGYNKRKKEAGNAMGAFFDDAVSSAEVRARKRLDAERSDEKKKPDRRAESLARELEATEALIAGLYASTAAYAENEAAGQRAALVADATAAAIKKQADVTTYVALQLRKAVAEQVNASVKGIAAMHAQNDAQEVVNKGVAAGIIPIEDAADALARLNEQRALVNTIKLAELNNDAKGAEIARAALADMNVEQQRAIDLRKQREDQTATAETNRTIEAIQKETELQRQLGEDRREALRGLSGDALENELQRLADQYEINAIILEYDTQITKANSAAQYENAKALEAKKQALIAQAEVGQGNANDERVLQRNIAYTKQAAHDVADIIGGGIGRAAHALIDAVSQIAAVADDLGGKFGVIGKMFSQGAKTGGAFGSLTGSSTGGAIGGGLGQVLGEKVLAKGLEKVMKGLGKFAGPLGAIAGGLLGGIIGGMLKKTPKASATVSIIAGEAMETAITGNKSALKKIAGGMADSVISGLSGLADTLGAELAGSAKVSIGVRKKSYRVDETGMGRTKGAGVQDFGEDQASAIAYAIQVAIKQGVLDGLSDSMKRLIMADGDFQAQLQKALSFKGVFDELAQKDDPAKWAQDAITKWHDGMAKIFAEAGATAAELAELERLTGIKRVDAANEAAKAASEKTRAGRELEIQIMELTGQASQALAATRAMELEQMDASLRPLQERVNALKDQAAATEAAATLEAGRLELLKELWAEQGRESVLRLHQLQAMDESYRAIQLEIWALQDQKKAAEELAAAQQKIAEEARGLQDRIDQLTGNTVAIRERELAAVDASNRALVQRIHALEDEAAAAAKAKAIADEADGLQSRWLQLIGDTAALRERELSALDPTNRALMSRIFAEEDRQAAEEKARAAAEEYTNSLRETVSGLSDMAQRIRDIAQEIREYKASLTEESAVAGNGYARTLAQFQSTSRMAALGNENSLSSFIGDAQAFLASAKENARSSLDYRRAIGMVSSGADSAIGGANALAASADAQAAALNATIAQTEVITSLGGSTVDLLAATNAALTDVVTPAIEDTIGGGIDALRLEIAGMRRDATERRDEEKAEAVAMVTNISAVRNILDRVNRGDSLAISLEDLISVLVANTTAQPVPTSEVV